jgi:pimeloyl-ACP methyl ester carboxylesterase
MKPVLWTAVCAALAACSPAISHPPSSRPEDPAMSTDSTSTADHRSPAASGRLPIRGLQMYYEIHGTGDATPLVVVPGGGSTIGATYGRLLPHLARQRRVIAVEEQAHGRTSDRGRPSSFEDSADDIAALLGQLGVARADVMGFSNGASIALELAIRHPAIVRRLVFASSMTRRSGTAPAFWDMIAHARFEDMPQVLKDEFLRVNPDPAALRTMYERDIERMRSFRDIPDADVAAVAAPALILAGDCDVPTTEHAVWLSHQLPHARLVILPGGHGDYLGELLAATKADRYPELTAWLLAQFLDSPT